jgi:hypothetical protein
VIQLTVNMADATPIRVRSAPSIPSKFETVLHLGTREPNAFGTRVTRLKVNVSEVPGPGLYAQPIVQPADSVSFSKKGYGGFASQSGRFTRNPFQRAPGPGTYAPATAGITDARTWSTRGMAVFATAVARTDEKPFERRPGPESYNIPSTLQVAKPRNSWVALPAFGTGGPRLMKQIPSAAPAPGTYDLPKQDSEHACRSAFQSNVPRASFLGVDLSSSTLSAADKFRPHPSQKTAVGVAPMPMIALKSETRMPGPGNYDPRMPEEIEPPHLAGAKCSAALAPSSHDRFGYPTDPRLQKEPSVVKAGHYYRDTTVQPSLISSSFFMSNTARIGLVQKKSAVPGPAYYHPVVNSKKNFHLNVSGTFV